MAAVSSVAASYSNQQGQISVTLSADSYCGKDAIITHNFGGAATGFVPTHVIYSGPAQDTQGYIGYLPSDESIYVVFRGSASLQNWISDFTTTKTSYITWPECNCQVHQGFYAASQEVYPDVLTEVQRLHALYPNYAVKTTGHSLGAALALLTQMDLIKDGFNASMYNFGQPRAGDKDFATFVSSKTQDSFRVTHYKDQVPHLPPPTYPLSFKHACTEEYEDLDGSVRTCSTTTCEDQSCADQWGDAQTNWDDHAFYLGHSMWCNGVDAQFLQ